MNGAGLTPGSVAGSRAGGVAGLWVRMLVSTISWHRFGGFAESDRVWFDEEVLGGWI